MTAIFLCSFIFIITTSINDVAEPTDRGEYLYDNYIEEVYYAMNSAILSKEDKSQRFEAYSDYFVSYARSIDINFSQVVIFMYDDRLMIINKFTKPVSIGLFLDSEMGEEREFIQLGPDGIMSSALTDNIDIKIESNVFTIDLDEAMQERNYAITGIYSYDRKFFKFNSA